MKYFVISDIHGSLGGAELLREGFEKHRCDSILLLGDVLYHGPRNDLPADYAPKQVIPLMNQFRSRIIAVRGNCDAEVDQMVLDFPLNADYQILFLRGRRVFVSHGHVYSPDRLPKLDSGDIFLSGHTHIPTAEKKDGVYLLNPGSCALPKNGHPCTYAVLDDSGFTVFAGDHQEYMQITF